jgi:hypothetical protein
MVVVSVVCAVTGHALFGDIAGYCDEKGRELNLPRSKSLRQLQLNKQNQGIIQLTFGTAWNLLNQGSRGKQNAVNSEVGY